MTATKQIPLLSKAAEDKFNQRCELSKEISALEKRVAELKKERSQLDAVLQEKWFVEGEEHRDRNGNIIVLQMVSVAPVIADDEWIAANRGKEIRKGYSFPKFNIIAG